MKSFGGRWKAKVFSGSFRRPRPLGQPEVSCSRHLPLRKSRILSSPQVLKGEISFTGLNFPAREG